MLFVGMFVISFNKIGKYLSFFFSLWTNSIYLQQKNTRQRITHLNEKILIERREWN